VYVFNCGPEMDYRTMGDIFKGLASSGSWGCFDEFNRLVPEVLSVCSVQYKAVLDAMRAGAANFKYEGVEYFLHEQGCMSFITMNPGYLGRAELPESLKVLFRPVTVMVPDMQMIMENMLMAEGYQEASILAKKFFTLYSLLKDLLSPQMHYDWGLRAIKSVLVQAGKFKRGEPDKSEAGLLMRALRDFNLPKIVEDDMIVFMGLIKDLFPAEFDAMPRSQDADFEKLVSEAAVEEKLQPEAYFVQNVVDLQDLLDIRHCVFTLGSSGANKSESWKTLARAWTKGGVRGKTIYRDINPKALTSNELYGFVNMATREWKDGLLSNIMRDLANSPDTNPKWIILDGDLDANWIENMNSVMDDNRLLTLASNERIRLLPHMRMVRRRRRHRRRRRRRRRRRLVPCARWPCGLRAPLNPAGRDDPFAGCPPLPRSSRSATSRTPRPPPSRAPASSSSRSAASGTTLSSRGWRRVPRRSPPRCRTRSRRRARRS
jgi:dynein heavy chain